SGKHVREYWQAVMPPPSRRGPRRSLSLTRPRAETNFSDAGVKGKGRIRYSRMPRRMENARSAEGNRPRAWSIASALARWLEIPVGPGTSRRGSPALLGIRGVRTTENRRRSPVDPLHVQL